MATDEDLEKKTKDEEADEADESEEKPAADPGSPLPAPLGRGEVRDDADPEAAAGAEGEEDPAAAPMQLGYMRFVYAAYMTGAMVVAFLVAKIGHVSWYRLGQWKPELGEPRDEILYAAAAVIGIGTAVYYWRKPDARQYANEVAEELSKVTWPSRKEVTNSTTVVVITTLFATVFFALMDQFWKYVTDKIYSF